ncbi:hypothetical protein [Thermomonas sp.]|uniref:hypothetical protein n=1 Tax=Thermomonas sp. TaxID=1971895 RepID=UPI002C1BCE3C|nr:hypothetical protein [Thermomonas sp.]HRO64161.1 hypothetical protein [Thermomonas sp.]
MSRFNRIYLGCAGVSFFIWMLSDSPYIDAIALAIMVFSAISAIIILFYEIFSKNEYRNDRFSVVLVYILALAFMSLSSEVRLAQVKGNVEKIACDGLIEASAGKEYLGRQWIRRSRNQLEGVSNDFGASINIYLIQYDRYFVIRGDHALGMSIYRKVEC